MLVAEKTGGDKNPAINKSITRSCFIFLGPIYVRNFGEVIRGRVNRAYYIVCYEGICSVMATLT